MSTLSDRSSKMVSLLMAAGKHLITGFCANIDGWESLLFSPTHHHHGNFIMIKADKQTNCALSRKALSVSDCLQEPLHCAFLLLLLLASEREGRKSRIILSEENPAGFQRLMTEAVSVSEPPEESGWKNVNTAVTNSTVQTG